MNKKTKMLLGVGVVAAAAYYFFMKKKTADEKAPKASILGGKVPRRGVRYGTQFNPATDISGVTYYIPS